MRRALRFQLAVVHQAASPNAAVMKPIVLSRDEQAHGFYRCGGFAKSISSRYNGRQRYQARLAPYSLTNEFGVMLINGCAFPDCLPCHFFAADTCPDLQAWTRRHCSDRAKYLHL
jgi:hypothetical protein